MLNITTEQEIFNPTQVFIAANDSVAITVGIDGPCSFFFTQWKSKKIIGFDLYGIY